MNGAVIEPSTRPLTIAGKPQTDEDVQLSIFEKKQTNKKINKKIAQSRK